MSNMIDYCYHTHTYRCGHARGLEEGYVKAALDSGFKVIGFSDHVFFPGVEQPGMRGSYSLLDDYINSIRNLQKKYEGKIEIHLGFECEFDEELEDYYHYLKDVKGIEYLIIGQHLFYNGGDLLFLGRMENREEMLIKYVDKIIAGMKTGLFAYIAHPDMVLRFFENITPFVEEQLRRLCKAAEYYQIPLEINMGGYRNCRNDTSNYLKYPNDQFFKIASEYNIDFIIGIDSHDSFNFYTNPDDFANAEKIIKDNNLKHVTRLDLNK